MLGSDEHFPPPNSPPGLLTRIRIDKVGGIGPLGLLTATRCPRRPRVCHHARRSRRGLCARWFALLFAALTISGAVPAAPASAVDAPIGRLGETLRVELMGVVADVTVHDILPSDVPPGFGYPPRAPALSGVPRQRHHPRHRDARAVRDRPGVLLQGRHADRRRVRAAELRCPRRPAVRHAERARRLRPPTAACGGTATATWCPTWCWSTRRPASTSRSGTCERRSRSPRGHCRRATRTRRRRRRRPSRWRARRR